MPLLVARRAVIARGAAVLAALASAVRHAFPTAAKPKKPKHGKPKKSSKLKAFRLATGCRASGGCSCHACELHAANKLFASQHDVVRAHPGCNCRITSLSLPSSDWAALFGPSKHPTTTAVDKRDPRVSQILSRH